MKSNIKQIICYLYLLVLFTVTSARRKTSSRRNRTFQLTHGRRIWASTPIEFTTSTTTTTDDTVDFPHPMLCIDNWIHRAVAEEATEMCCKKVGVPCKQREHIGQPTEYDCIAENLEQFNAMRVCCHKNAKTWRRGKVADGIDCQHKNHTMDK